MSGREDLRAYEAQRRRDANHSGETEESGDNVVRLKQGDFPPHTSLPPHSQRRFPEPLGEAAYWGLAGRIAREIEPYSEADPAALLGSTLLMYGNAVGRGPHFRAGDAVHPTNLFLAIVGPTSSGRKGTSGESPRRLLALADPSWDRCVGSGVTSGEGLIHHVRDERRERRKAKKGEIADANGIVDEVADYGAHDKRLLVYEPEFARVLSVITRKDNTVSSTLRDFWDKGNAQTLSKNAPERATGALVSVLAHITPAELRAKLDSTEIANGFANRFLFIAARRSKLLPRGGNTPKGIIDALVPRLRDALEHGRRLAEVDMTETAWKLWDSHYERLTDRPAGLAGEVTGRAAPIVRRIALVYALLDERSAVHDEHLRAALEVWRYAEESVRWAFGDRLGDRLADRCLALLREAGSMGMTRTDLRQAVGHRMPAERIADALEMLQEAKLARYVMESTGGRSAERWFAVSQDDQSAR